MSAEYWQSGECRELFWSSDEIQRLQELNLLYPENESCEGCEVYSGQVMSPERIDASLESSSP